MSFFCPKQRMTLPKIVMLLLAVVLLLRFFYFQSRFSYDEPFLTIGAMQFQKRTIVIESGQMYQLHLNRLNKRISYTSKNSLVAYVNGSGRIFALKPGKTVIEATVGEDVVKSRVYVVKIDKKVVLSVGETTRIGLRGAVAGISYKSANRSIAGVSMFGRVTGVCKGKTIVTVTIRGFSFTVEVIVE